MAKEIWKDIPNYEGIYQASNLGRIRTAPNKTTSNARYGKRVWSVRVLKGRGDNYKTGSRVSLWKEGRCKDWLVARLVAMTFLGIPKESDTVNHKNGNRLDNHIENLEWLSLSDNIRHAFDTGLMPYKKVKLYNKDCELIFRSLAKASEFLGHNAGYISGCLKRKHKIVDKKGVEYSIELL